MQEAASAYVTGSQRGKEKVDAVALRALSSGSFFFFFF
jgi:hypothetical protein